MKEEHEKKEERIRCQRCDSKFGYLRIKDHVWICRSCGFENKEVVA